MMNPNTIHIASRCSFEPKSIMLETRASPHSKNRRNATVSYNPGDSSNGDSGPGVEFYFFESHRIHPNSLIA